MKYIFDRNLKVLGFFFFVKLEFPMSIMDYKVSCFLTFHEQVWPLNIYLDRECDNHYISVTFVWREKASKVTFGAKKKKKNLFSNKLVFLSLSLCKGTNQGQV